MLAPCPDPAEEGAHRPRKSGEAGVRDIYALNPDDGPTRKWDNEVKGRSLSELDLCFDRFLAPSKALD